MLRWQHERREVILVVLADVGRVPQLVELTDAD